MIFSTVVFLADRGTAALFREMAHYNNYLTASQGRKEGKKRIKKRTKAFVHVIRTFVKI